MTSTEAQPAPTRDRRLQPFASFRYRGYPWLWAANVTYGAVQGAQGFVLAWLVLDMSGSSAALALVTITVALPALLLALPAGWLADRRDRRLLLMVSHVAVASVLLLMAVLAAGDLLSLGLTWVLALLTAAGMALGLPARLALIPTLVPRERILNGNALNELGMGLGIVIGIPLAGVGISQWGVEGGFLLLAVFSAVGALFLLPLRVPERETGTGQEQAPAGIAEPDTIRNDFVEAFRFLWRAVELRMLFVLLLAGVVGPWLALDISAVRDKLDLTVREWSVLGLFLGVGSLLTTGALAAIPRLRGAGLWYGIAIVASVAVAVGVWLSSSYGLTGFLMALFGLALGVRSVLVLTLVQAHTPIAVMGRVMGVYVALTAAAGLLAQPITRAGQALLQDDGWVVFSALVLVGVVALVLWRSPGLRRMSTDPQSAETADAEATPTPGPG